MGTWRFTVGDTFIEGSGATQQEAKLDAVTKHNRAAGAAVTPQPGQAKPGREPDTVGKVKRWILGDAVSGAGLQGDVRDPRTLGAAAKGIGEVMLPGSNAEAAVMAALGPAGKVGSRAAGAIGGRAGAAAGLAARAGAPVAAGAAAGALEGGTEGAVEGAKLGATGAAIAEGGKFVGQTLREGYGAFGHPDYVFFQRRVRDKIGPDLAKGLTAPDTIPSLKGVIKDTSDLNNFVEKGRTFFSGQSGAPGAAKQPGAFDKMDTRILAALKGQPVEIPSEALALWTGNQPGGTQTVRGMANQIPVKTVPVAPEQALEISRFVRGLAEHKTQDVTGRPMRVLADETHQALTSKLVSADPALAKSFEQLRSDYSKYLQFGNIIEGKESVFFPPLTKTGPTIDLPRLYNATNEQLEMHRFPGLFRAFRGGDPGAVGPRRTSLLPLGVRLYQRGALSETAPRVPAVQLTPSMEQTLGARGPGIISGAGRAAAVGATPAIGEAQQ